MTIRITRTFNTYGTRLIFVYLSILLTTNLIVNVSLSALTAALMLLRELQRKNKDASIYQQQKHMDANATFRKQTCHVPVFLQILVFQILSLIPIIRAINQLIGLFI